jgi:hypothetical protein
LHLFVPFSFPFFFFFMLHIGDDGGGQLDEHDRVRGHAQVLATTNIMEKDRIVFRYLYEMFVILCV